MRIHLKSLYRSPLKTAVTLLLLAAAAFLFLYNLAEYSEADREYSEARDKYEGVLTVEIPGEAEPDAMHDRFLMSDPTYPGKTFELEFLKPERWHQVSLGDELMESLGKLPYISRVERRYMTAGLSRDYTRMDTDTHFYAYSARCVLAATVLERAIADDSYLTPNLEPGGTQELKLGDVEVLAGNPVQLWGQDVEYVQIQVPLADPEDGWVQLFNMDTSSRASLFSLDTRLTLDDVNALEPGRRYVFVLRDHRGDSWMTELKDVHGAVHAFRVGDDSLVDWWPYFTDITDLPENWLEGDEFADLRELINVTNDDAHTFDVVYGDDMASIRRVAQGRIVCDEGRFITPGDAGQAVCVVSKDFLKTNKLTIGDSITLDLGNYLSEPYAPLGAVASTRMRQSTEYKTQTFTIIGAWRDLNEGNHVDRDLYWCWSNNAIFVPTAFLPDCVNADTYDPKPNDVSFVVGNAENILAFAEKCLPQVDNLGLNYSFDDWGWSQVAKDLMQARDLARVKLLIFTGASAFAILLTVWLFIGRRKRDFGILRALGMPVGAASGCLFFPFLFLSGIAVVLGAVVARAVNLRQMTVSPGLPVYILGAAGFLVVLAVLACGDLLLLRRRSILALVNGSEGRVKPAPQEEIVSSGTFPERDVAHNKEDAFLGESGSGTEVTRDRGGSRKGHWGGRYLRRLLYRNFGRNVLCLLLAALLVFAFGVITVLRSIYGELYRHVEIKANITGGITYKRAERLLQSGYVRDPYYEANIHNGQVEMSYDAEVIFTNRLSRLAASPVEWLEGWDEETAMNAEEKVCVMNACFAEELGLGLGDMVRLNEKEWWLNLTAYGLDAQKDSETPQEKRDRYRPFVQIVGLIQNETKDHRVYLPAAAWMRFSFFLPQGNLDLAEYTLVDYHKAAEFEAYAADEFSLAKQELTLQIDTSYADRIYQIHRLIETLYPLTIAAALLLGSILPGLAVLHSSKEISILRALGVRARDCVILYTLSQVLCALAGLVLGIAAVLVALRPEWSAVVVPFAVYLAAHLAACALGSGVFAWLCARKRVLEQLQAKE